MRLGFVMQRQFHTELYWGSLCESWIHSGWGNLWETGDSCEVGPWFKILRNMTRIAWDVLVSRLNGMKHVYTAKNQTLYTLSWDVLCVSHMSHGTCSKIMCFSTFSFKIEERDTRHPVSRIAARRSLTASSKNLINLFFACVHSVWEERFEPDRRFEPETPNLKKKMVISLFLL